MKDSDDLLNSALAGVEYNQIRAHRPDTLQVNMQDWAVEARCSVLGITLTCGTERTQHSNRRKLNKAILALREAMQGDAIKTLIEFADHQCNEIGCECYEGCICGYSKVRCATKRLKEALFYSLA